MIAPRSHRRRHRKHRVYSRRHRLLRLRLMWEWAPKVGDWA